jgi:hypothetical protein
MENYDLYACIFFSFYKIKLIYIIKEQLFIMTNIINTIKSLFKFIFGVHGNIKGDFLVLLAKIEGLMCPSVHKQTEPNLLDLFN